MAARKRSRVAPGFRQAFPDLLGDALARQFGGLSRVAYRLAGEKVVRTVAAGNEAETARLLADIDGQIAEAFPDSTIVDRAARVGKTLNRAHRKQFFEALSGSLGAVLVGTDDSDDREAFRVYTSFLNPARGVPLAGKAPIYAVPLNVEPGLFVDQFVAENVRLIGTVRQGITKGMRDQIVREVTFGGGDPVALQQEILRKWAKEGVPSLIPIANGTRVVSAEKHAAFIARDQLAKLNGQLTKSRQLAAGIDEATWVTQGDSHVRHQHRLYNGRRFAWTVGIDGVFPGQPIACRCWASAVADESKLREHWERQRINPPGLQFELLT